MPPIDPQQLLRALGPLLTDQGGIKGAQAALQIASLMKDASKLVSKCVYLNILRATESEEAFTKFIEVGGWDTLNAWLDMARNENNSPLLGELLEVYLRIPVTVALLKQNTAAKTIKKMQGKTEDDKIKNLSTQLVDVWMKTIRGQNNGTDADLDDKKKKKKHKDKDSEKEKDIEKDKDKNHKESKRSKEEKENSERNRSRDKDSKEREDQDNNRDKKDRDRQKEKDRSRRDKLKTDSKDSSSKSSSSSSHNKHKETISNSSKKSLGEDSKITPTPTLDAASASEKSKSVNADSNKEDESRRRLKTVKAIGSRIRSTGLFEDDDDEVESTKKTFEKPAIKRVSNLEPKGEESSEKKPRLHINMPSFSTPGLSSANTTPPEIMHGRIKIIPAKKPHEIQESNVFMAALQQSSYASIGLKKKKKAASPSTTNPPVLLRGGPTVSLNSSTTPTTMATSPPPQGGDAVAGNEPGPTSPPLLSPNTAMAQKLPSVPSFYRDTLEETPESDKKQEKEEEGRDSPPTLDLMRPLEPEPEQQGEQEMEVSKSEEPPLDFDNAEAVQEAGTEEEPPKPSKPKKRVSWARESQMEQIFYFEMDENERENVNRPKSFSDLKREEMMLDRRAMESAKHFNNDNMVEVLQWKLPKPIDNVIVVVETGCNSVEKQIQMEREQSVLCALFFNKVPDTPNEPDPEIPSEEEDIKVIPLEDENGSCTEYEHTYNFNDPSSLPYDPEFGTLPLLGQNAAGGHQSNSQTGGPPPGLHGNNMSGPGGGSGGNMSHMTSNLPPGISHILNVLKQQAQETRDPVIQSLQGMLTSVLQTTNPQDSGLLVDRILNALEPFMNQIPGLSSLISSVKGNGGMEFPGGGGGPGGRFMGHPTGPGGPMGGGNPRHGLLGSAPPGFNMEGGGGGNMRPPHGLSSGPMSMMNNGGGNYFGGGGGGGGGGMQMGGPPPGHWRGGGGGRSRPFKQGNHRNNTVCVFYAKSGDCRYGDSCKFFHPNS